MNATPGIMFRCQYPPEALIPFARDAEAAGFGELWIVEDCFFNSAIAATTTALAATDGINVGIGIMPAVARNPAFTAMELATLARLYPGRVLPGMGHGVADWMRQIGAFPSSQLAALEETTIVVRRLLAGENVTFHGRHVHLDQVELTHKPGVVPPISLGVRGIKSLTLSGRSADGTIVAECSSPAYIRWARAQIANGQAESGRTGQPHRLTVYALCAVDDAEPKRALDRMRPVLASVLSSPEFIQPLSQNDFAEAILALRERGRHAMIDEMPDAWITALTAAGTSAQCRAFCDSLFEAGADSVVLVPLEDETNPITALKRIL